MLVLAIQLSRNEARQSAPKKRNRGGTDHFEPTTDEDKSCKSVELEEVE